MADLVKHQEAVCKTPRGGCGIDIIRRVVVNLEAPGVSSLGFCPKCRRPVIFADVVKGKSNWPENYKFK